METYKVEDFSLGSRTQGDKIVFKTLEDMERAYKDIDNGNDVYIEKEGYIRRISSIVRMARAPIFRYQAGFLCLS